MSGQAKASDLSPRSSPEKEKEQEIEQEPNVMGAVEVYDTGVGVATGVTVGGGVDILDAAAGAYSVSGPVKSIAGAKSQKELKEKHLKEMGTKESKDNVSK